MKTIDEVLNLYGQNYSYGDSFGGLNNVEAKQALLDIILECKPKKHPRAVSSAPSLDKDYNEAYFKGCNDGYDGFEANIRKAFDEKD